MRGRHRRNAPDVFTQLRDEKAERASFHYAELEGQSASRFHRADIPRGPMLLSTVKMDPNLREDRQTLEGPSFTSPHAPPACRTYLGGIREGQDSEPLASPAGLSAPSLSNPWSNIGRMSFSISLWAIIRGGGKLQVVIRLVDEIKYSCKSFVL